MPLDNANQPTEPSLSEADRADMEVFLAHMLGMLPVLGVHAFEQAPHNGDNVNDGIEGPLLFCRGKQVEARGYESTKGFVVLTGSQAVVGRHEIPDRVRDDLSSSGVLARDGAVLRFAQDFVFRSPSSAAGHVLGRSSNGRLEWKDAQGRTLKELQEAEAEN
ncbi:MAG: DUF4357 domain-containing protein [Burkholderiaceae bacterium]